MRTTRESFRDLNRRRAARGLPPVHPVRRDARVRLDPFFAAFESAIHAHRSTEATAMLRWLQRRLVRA